MKIVVPQFPGTNCEFDTKYAFERLGHEVSIVWHEDETIPADTELVVVPGGFSYGDYLRSGAIARFSPIMKAVKAYADNGGYVLGICNGFQVLVRLGFLPGGGKGEGALLVNRSGRFEDRWVYLRAASEPSPWFEAGTIYRMPVAHAEGRFAWFPIVDGDPFPREQIAFCYCDGSGGDCRYPEDPNGSHQQIAGVLSPDGNVLGMMPHPERFLRAEHHPSWMRMRRADGTIPREEDLPQPLGLDIFRRAVAHLRQRVATESR